MTMESANPQEASRPRIIEKHYSQWIDIRQKTLEQAVRMVWAS